MNTLPRNFATKYSDAESDPLRGEYRIPMARFNTTPTTTSASLFSHVTSVGVAVPHAYIGIFDVPGCLGGKTLLLHGISRFPSSQGAPSQWEGRTFAFAQDVVDDHGDILTVELEEHLFRVTDGANTTTIPASIAARDALWAAAPITAQLLDDILPVAAADDDADVGTIETKTRHLMYLPTKYIPLVIRERLNPRQLWDRLAHHIVDEGDAAHCQNLLEWATMIGFRDNTVVLPALVVPAGDAELFQHRRQVLYHQLPGLQARSVVAETSEAHVHHLLGELVQEHRLARVAAAEQRLTPKPPRTPLLLWGDRLPQLLFLCGVESEAELPRLWHTLAAASNAVDRHNLAGFMRTLAVSDRHDGQGPIVTPELTKRLIALNFAGDDRDDLSQGLQPFNLAYSNPGDAASSAQAAALHRANEEHDQLMLGSASQTLANIRELRAVAAITLPATFGQAKRKLVALRILLLGMLGEHHSLYRAYVGFVERYITRDEMWNGRMARVSHAPAILLRFVQLKLHNWFQLQETQEFLPPAPAPDFRFLFEQLEVDSLAWVPAIPSAYMEPGSIPNPPRGRQPTLPGGAPAPPNPATPAAKPKAVPVTNPTPSPLVAKFHAALKDLQLRDLIVKSGQQPPGLMRNGVWSPMCATWHLRGKCFDTCARAADHIVHTDLENAPLAAWVTAALA